MRQKKLVKQLMAAGVQRNDAAAFVKTYRAVKDAGLTRLFPELELPPAPVIQTRTVRPERLCAKYTVDSYEMNYRGGSVDWDAYMNKRLVKELAHRLKDSGLVCFSKRATPLWTEFCAEVRVLPMDAKEVQEPWF